MKNALQSVIDSIKSGAIKFAEQTPVGQLVTKMGQAPQILRAPTMEDLTNSYNQAVGRVSSFVQQNPTPASFVLRQVPQITQAPIKVVAPKAQQVFQENMRLLSRPMQSLTTETPAARFLINKVGGPASNMMTGELTGPQTVGNYLASNIEQSIPGLLPIMGLGTSGVNVFKQGVNVPAMMRSGAAMSAFSAGLRALKGEKPTKEDLASSFAMGAIFGAVEPKPMAGLATTELGLARKALSKYGFKLSDYNSPTLLKSKFRENILKLHPDKGGSAEEFKAFIDAYNKVTSAGIDSAWKFPDIMGWMRNLWTKKQQPTAQGLKIAQQSSAIPVVTQQTFGKIADIVRKESGEGSHIFEGSQIRTVLKQIGLKNLPEGTVDTPGFVVQYMKKDPVTKQPIVPRLVVNIMPQEAAVAASVPSVAPTPVVTPQMQTPVVAPITPITPPTVTTATQVATPAVVVSKTKKTAPYEPLAPSSIDYIREMRRLVNVGELQKMTKMSNAEINGYVTKLFPTPKVSTGIVKDKNTIQISDNNVEFPTEQKISEWRTKKQQLLKQGTGYVSEKADIIVKDANGVELSRINYDDAIKKFGTTNKNDIAQQLVNGQSFSTGVGVIPTRVVETAYQNILKTGGVTIDLGGKTPSEGFAYAPSKDTEFSKPIEKFTEQDLLDYIDKNYELLSQPGNHIGGWTDGGKRYLDISQVGPPTVETLQKAMDAKQLAVFDLATFNDIPLGKIDKGVYNPIDEATNVFDQYRRKIQGANQTGSVGSPSQIPAGGETSLPATTPVQIPSATQQVTPSIEKVPTEYNALGQPISQGTREVVPPTTSVVGTPSPQVPTTISTIIPEGKMKGFAKTVLESDKTKEELKQKILDDINSHFYKVLHNPEAVDAAQKMIATDREETLSRILDLKDIDPKLEAAGMLLMNQLQYEGDYNTADTIERALEEKALLSGQTGQIHAIWDKLTPDGKLHYARRIIGEVKGKMGLLDKLVNRVNGIEESPKIAKQLSNKLNEINKEALQTITQEVIGKFQKLAKKITEQGEKPSPDELLGKRIIRYVKSLTTNLEKEKDPIRVMVNTLYNVAREVLPEKKIINKNPLEFITDAIKDKKHYRDVWTTAQDIVKEKFSDKPEALEQLDDYFVYYLEKPFSQNQLNQVVANKIKEGDIDIAEVVRSYYVDAQKQFGETLATRLSEEAGLSNEDARMLEKYVVDRFNELTRVKKEQILSALVREYPKVIPKSFIQNVIELSNLGAFSDKKYYDLLAKKLNIPNVSENLANEIYTKTQELQKLSVDSPERIKMTQTVMDLIGDQVPVGAMQYIDSYRKNNLLSNPRTHMRNFTFNLGEATFTLPATMTAQATVDMIQSVLTGKDRQTYFSQIPAYYKQLINGIPNAAEKFMQSWRGTIPNENPDLKTLQWRKINKTLPAISYMGRAMEASDQFFQTVIAGAYSSALQSSGIPKELADQTGLNQAQYVLLRAKLDPQNKTGQGGLLSGIDKATTGLLAVRTGIPLIDWFMPFVSVPAQYAKRTLEYNPITGILIDFQVGKERRKQQQAKTLLGLIVMLLGLAKAMNGETTWELPKDKKERESWYDAGIKPYSIKIGNYYVPMQLFGPFFLALAIPAAVRYYEKDSPTALTDTTSKKLFNLAWGMTRAYMNLTFLSNIGNFFRAVEGDLEVSLSSVSANLISQMSYMIGFTRYLSTLVDPVYRRTDDFWGALLKNYPFFTKKLEPYRNLKGEESKRNISSFVLPYDIGITNPEAYYLWSQRNEQLRQYKVINDVIKQIEIPDYITKDSQEELDYMISHPETEYLSDINSLKSQLVKIGSEEFKIYGDKEMSTNEKNIVFDDFQKQKEDILNQLNDVFQEIRKVKGQPETRNVFDEVEAAGMAEDFTNITQQMQPELTSIVNESKFFDEQLKSLHDTQDKFKKLRDRFDRELKITNDTTFPKSIVVAKNAGIDSNIAIYDYWSAQTETERGLYINSLIDGKSGNDIWNTLISLRTESPGTGNMVLTDTLVTDLVNNQIITKAMGTQLKKIRVQTDANGKPLENLKITPLSTGTTTKTKAAVNKMSSLLKQRSTAYQKALKIKAPTKSSGVKVKLSKLPVFKPIKVAKVKSSTPKTFKLKLPKLKSIQVPISLKGLIRGSPRLY